ncbi:MAG: aldehyde dehydrogenase family protein [Flavobacteriaceae bacterium]|nr:aldehyde dehydrogenase family protein [Flavobacteriaceae bacterium]
MNIELQKQLDLAVKAQEEWRKVSFKDRQELLKNLAKSITENVEEYSRLITSEMHKPIVQSRSEVKKCVLVTDYYANAENVLEPEKVETELSVSEVLYQPMGVILGIMPWNFPFWQALRFAVPTILAGNVVLMKHASICKGSGRAIEELFRKSGFPEGILQNIEYSYADIEELIAHPQVKGVSLTGSEATGRKIASLAGASIKKSLLELGGNDAFIVLDDVNLEETAKQGAAARLRNGGQACTSAKRFIIQENVYDDFVENLVEEFKKYELGDPFAEETQLSGLATKSFADELQAQYEKAIAHGAEVILPLERVDDTSFKPGLIKVNLDNPIIDEELFGPLAMIISAKDDEEILKIANDSNFGLGNSVWTKDKDRAYFFAKNLESGTVSVNKLMTSDPRFPFGGTKNSGYGLELSLKTLTEFCVTKSIFGNV